MAAGRGHWNYRLTKWLLAAGLLTTVLVLTACECGTTPPLQTTLPTPITTTTPPATTTPPPPATTTPPTTTTTPPEVKEGLAILSHSSYVDNFGYFRLVGEVENISVQNTTSNKITATFYDNQGNIVASGSNECYLKVIRPGEKSPFEIVFLSIPLSENYKLTTSWEYTDEQPSVGIEINSVELQIEEGGLYGITGSLANNGINSYEFVIVICTFYNDVGDVVAVGFTFIDYSPFNPGGKANFMILVDPNVAENISSHFLQVEGI